MEQEAHKYTEEPIIHSAISNSLTEETLVRIKLRCIVLSLDFTDGHLRCAQCLVMLHSIALNECFRTWYETEFGFYCIECWTIRDHMLFLEQNLQTREPYRIIDRIRQGKYKKEVWKRKRARLF